jgi:hypothetical protein
MMSRTLLRACLAVGSLFVDGSMARASVVYAFTYTAVNGPIQSFSFDVTSPGFFGVGAPAFTPFTITDGTNSWVMTEDASTPDCIVFATTGGGATSGLAGPPFPGYFCGFGTPFFAGSGGFLISLNNGDLASAGSFKTPADGEGFGQFYTPAVVPEQISTFDFAVPTTGSMEMDITLTPEPSLTIPLLIVLVGIGVAVRQRHCSDREKVHRTSGG